MMHRVVIVLDEDDNAGNGHRDDDKQSMSHYICPQYKLTIGVASCSHGISCAEANGTTS